MHRTQGKVQYKNISLQTRETIVITLITRTPQPHHKTGYHSESLLIKSKHSLGFNFNFLECTLDGAVILWLEKHIWNHFFHCAEHAGAQMVQVRPNVLNIKSGSALKNKSSRLERKNWFPKFKGRWYILYHPKVSLEPLETMKITQAKESDRDGF